MKYSISMSLVTLTAALSSGMLSSNSLASPRVFATAQISECTETTSDTIRGTATLSERPSDEGVKLVDVVLRVRGLPPGKHAVHIHETAACEPCGAAGGHFDPGEFGETNPDANHPFHSGDLININAKSKGHAVMHTITSRVTLSSGTLSLFDEDGSAFIIHVDPDTYCPDHPDELAGCAGGARLACGVISPR